jgi:hypothetical protein
MITTMTTASKIQVLSPNSVIELDKRLPQFPGEVPNILGRLPQFSGKVPNILGRLPQFFTATFEEYKIVHSNQKCYIFAP